MGKSRIIVGIIAALACNKKTKNPVSSVLVVYNHQELLD